MFSFQRHPVPLGTTLSCVWGGVCVCVCVCVAAHTGVFGGVCTLGGESRTPGNHWAGLTDEKQKEVSCLRDSKAMDRQAAKTK